MKRSRRKVNWLPGAKQEQKKLPQPPVYRTRDLTEEEHNELVPNLIQGSLWLTCIPMYITDNSKDHYYARHELAYVMPLSYGLTQSGAPPIPMNTMAIYMGTVHVDESSSRFNNVCRILRHVFLINGQRVMSGVICDEFKPVS
jgi:hypothetical protein